MPLVGSSALGENMLKSSANVPADPVVTVSTPLAPDVLAVPLLLPPQAASRPTATIVAPAAIPRTRQGLDNIGDSLFSFSLGFQSCWNTRWRIPPPLCARTAGVVADAEPASLSGYVFGGPARRAAVAPG